MCSTPWVDAAGVMWYAAGVLGARVVGVVLPWADAAGGSEVVRSGVVVQQLKQNQQYIIRFFDSGRQGCFPWHSIEEVAFVTLRGLIRNRSLNGLAGEVIGVADDASGTPRICVYLETDRVVKVHYTCIHSFDD